MNQSIASAVFDNEAEADRAISDLRQAGVPDSALSIIAQENGRTTTTSGTGETEHEGGSILRGLLGGGALGAGLGVAALAIPGVGPLAALGAIAASAVPGAMTVGAVAGAAAGTLNESLTKHGIDRTDADYYEGHLGRGGTLVSVDGTSTGPDASTVRDILYRNGGHSSTQSRMSTTY